MNWYQERRLDWIEDRLLSAGTLQRSDIMTYFGVSLPQASKDIQAYQRLNKALVYDKSAKVYRLVQRGQKPLSIRASTPQRRDAWGVF
jgi:hypothetical protein